MEALLTTRSPAEEGPRSGEGLPVSFDRRFRPWRYSVSHSELSLRSVDGEPDDVIIEVRFYGVVGMKLKAVYKSLSLSLATPTEAEKILRFADIRESYASKVKCVALNAGADDSFVACMRFSIWAHPRDADHDSSGLPRRESTLILRH